MSLSGCVVLAEALAKESKKNKELYDACVKALDLIDELALKLVNNNIDAVLEWRAGSETYRAIITAMVKSKMP